MSNETERNDRILSQDCSQLSFPPTTWTLESLRLYFDTKVDLLEEKTKERFSAAKENINIALLASEKAIVKAEVANDKRFESVNEFRGSLSDQTSNFIPRSEYAVQHASLLEKVDSLLARILTLETRLLTKKEGLSIMGAVILGGFAAAATLISLASFIYNIEWHLK